MLIRNEDVETLICLGLTERQAKVYLALVRMGISKVDAISLGSTVHRSEVYRVVADLEKKGLVHVKLSTPKLFSAVPITDAVEILIKRRKDEFFKVQEKAEWLSEKLELIYKPPSLKFENVEFDLVSNDEFAKKIEHAIENARERIQVITNMKRIYTTASLFGNELSKSLKRGIEWKLIIENQNDCRLPKWIMRALIAKKPLLELKIVPDCYSLCVSIYDNKKVSLCVNSSLALQDAHLWSTNIAMIALSQAYFEMMWTKGT